MNPNLKYLEAQALALLNVPYKWGGQSPLEGLDCSGLIVYLWKCIGHVKEEFDASAQSLLNLSLSLPYRKTTELGSLVFYGQSKDSIKHVAFCLTDKLIIEAIGDSTVSSFTEAMKWRNSKGALIRVSPIRRRSDQVACLRPVYQCLGENS